MHRTAQMIQNAAEYVADPIMHQYHESLAEFAADINTSSDGWTFDLPAGIGNTLRVEGHRFTAEQLSRVVAMAEKLNKESYDYLHSTAEVAKKLGVTPRRVQELAKSRGRGRQVGRSFVFTHADIDAMRDRVPGRPAKEHR